MADGNQRAYAALKYEGCAFPDTHPGHLWAVATLMGLSPPAPQTSRVLEIGCGDGGNLLPIAASLPKSQCVGLDLSAEHLALAERGRAALGLRHLTLHHADLAQIEPGLLGTYDYIIAHGVYSWVSDEARVALRRLCRDHLAEDGVLYMSHNTYPGWHQREAARAMMQYHTRSISDPEAQVAASKALMRFLADAAPDQGSHYAAWLREEADRLDGTSTHYVFHDHLGVHSAPFYLHQVVADFAEVGLSFLADAHLPSNFGGLLPGAVTEQLSQRVEGDRLAFEQHQDFLVNRQFRKTLLTRATPDGQHLYPERWMTGHAASRATFDPASRTWRLGDRSLPIHNPVEASVLQALAAAWPETVPVEALYRGYAEGGAAPISAEDFCQGLFMLVMRDLAQVSGAPVTLSSAAARPRVLPWVAQEIREGRRNQTTAHHRAVALDGSLRALASLADGRRDLKALASGLRAAARAGDLALPASQQSTHHLRASVQRGVAQLRALGLLA